MFQEYPYTNYHDINLDWIIKTITDLNNKFNGDAPILTTDNVVQTKGSSTTNVMSQNAVTDSFTELDDIYVEKQKVVSSSDITPSQGLIYDSVAVSQFASDLTEDTLHTDDITQTLGQNTNLIMSQKAVTDAIQSANNTTRVITNFSDNVSQSVSWIGVDHTINDLPNFTQTATITLTPQSVPANSALNIRSFDTNNNVIDQKGWTWNGLNPVSITLNLPPVHGVIRLYGQSQNSYVLNESVSHLKVSDNSLLQTTGQSTAQAMSQKAVTDAINAVDCEYDVISLSADNTVTPLAGIYDAYEKNTVYLYTDSSNRKYALAKMGGYQLVGTSDYVNEYHNIRITINQNDTITVTALNNYNIISAYRSAGGAIYNNTYINSVLPSYTTISIGNFSASTSLGASLYHWAGNTTDSVTANVMYFPCQLDSIQAAGNFIYAWKRANETTIHFICPGSMPAMSTTFNINVFRVLISS